MNRNYKVIWNRSLGCFTAVAEYAKSRGKSSSGAVTSNASLTSSVVRGKKWLRLSSLCLGLAAAGLSLQAIAMAPATGAFYVGVNSTANGTNYNGEGATGENAMAMGRNSAASGSQAISIGSSQYGQKTTASGEQSIAIGANVVSSGNSSIAIGGDDLDDASNMDGVNALFDTYTGGIGGLVAVGDYSGHTQSLGAASVAIGVKARSEGDLSTAVGVRSSSAGAASSAFGMGSSASLDGSVALGAGSTTATNATPETTMAVGGKTYNVAGQAANAGAQVSVGSAGKERQIKHVAAGAVNKYSTDAVNGSQLHATNTVVNKGFGLKAADGHTVMKPLGEQVEVVGSNNNIDTRVKNGKIEVALNNNLDLGKTGSVTMGSSAPWGLGLVTTVDRLGMRTGDSLVSTNVNALGVFVNGPAGIPLTTLTANGLDIIGGPSVTRSGIDAGNKRIIRVSNGIDPTDAVNVSQLTSSAAGAKTEVEAGTNVAVTNVPGANGQNVYTIDADGTTVSGSDAVTVTAGTKNALTNLTDYAVDLSQVTKDSLEKADNSVQYDGPTKTSVTLGGAGATAPVTLTNVKAGTTEFDAVNFGQLEDVSDVASSAMQNVITQIDGVTVKTLSKDDNKANFVTGSNILLEDDGLGGIKVSTAQDLLLNSVTMGNTIVNSDGLSFIGGSTVSVKSTGISAGNNTITNVKRGSELTDAVNVEQLNEVKQSAADANRGWDISAQGENTSTVKPSDTVDLNNTDNNITVSKTAESNDITFNLSKDINLDSATFGDVKISASGLDNGGKIITGVGDGLIAADSKEAINGGQIYEMNQMISDIDNSTSVLAEQMDAGLNFGADTGDAINKKLGDTALNFKGGNNITTTAVGSSIQFDLNGEISLDKVVTGNTSMNSNGITITGGPSMTLDNGIDAGNKKVTRVLAGDVSATSIDAINGSQLYNVSRNLGNSINELGYKIGEVEDDANAGISAAMAMSSLPQSNIAGRSMIGGGIASYNGESAVAIGMSRVSDNGRWVIKVNGTADTQGNAGGAIGAGFHF